MRTYSIVLPQFWIGETGPEICAQGPEAVVVAFYLLSCPLSNMIGLYYLPLGVMSEETRIPLEGIREPLLRVVKTGYAKYDFNKSVVWVPEMAKIQIGETLKPNDNRIKNVQELLKQYSKSMFYQEFLDRYQEPYHLVGLQRASEGASAPPRKPGTGTGTVLRREEGDASHQNGNNANTSAVVLAITADRKPKGPTKQQLAELDMSMDLDKWMRKKAAEANKKWEHSKQKTNRGPTPGMMEELLEKERQCGALLRRWWVLYLRSPESNGPHYPYQYFLNTFIIDRFDELQQQQVVPPKKSTEDVLSQRKQQRIDPSKL